MSTRGSMTFCFIMSLLDIIAFNLILWLIDDIQICKEHKTLKLSNILQILEIRQCYVSVCLSLNYEERLSIYNIYINIKEGCYTGQHRSTSLSLDTSLLFFPSVKTFSWMMNVRTRELYLYCYKIILRCWLTRYGGPVRVWVFPLPVWP